MALPDTIARHFDRQAAACDGLGSPFNAMVCRLLGHRLNPGESAFATRLADWPGDTHADGLSVRAIGGLNALARSGRCPPLTAAYPPNVVDEATLWSAIVAAVAQEDAFLTAYLDGPPQTNEVGRSAVLLGGFLAIAAATGGIPLDILEVGASAGLNLSFDRYRYDLGVGQWGPADSTVHIATPWEGTPPDLAAPLTVASRAGCDLKPIDPASPADRDRLMSYIWPDQRVRVARTEAALAAAAASGIRAEKADAGTWLVEKLAAPAIPGHVRVIFHTIVWQYIPAAVTRILEDAIRAAGTRATREAPVAWLAMEDDATPGSAGVRLTLWPTGETRLLGRADFHGRWVRWGDAA
jgi:hypothetical protein